MAGEADGLVTRDRGQRERDQGERDRTSLALSATFSELAGKLNSHPDVDQTLRSVVDFAVQTIPGCDFAGVSWARTGEVIETPVASSEEVRQADEVQYELNEGPCVETATLGEPRVVTDFHDEPRWPQFAARCVELGMNSLMSCQLSSPKAVLGALNLYSRDIGSFDDPDTQQIAIIFANHVSIALANRVLESDLRAAIETRGLIGQAIGILVERHRVTPTQGFELLVRGSQRLHVKLRELAEQVVETGQDPAAMAR